MPIARRTSLLSAGASLAVLLCLILVIAVGPLGLAVPLAAVVVLGLIARPPIAVGVVVFGTILAEGEADWGPTSLPSRLYETIPGARLTVIEVLMLIALIAVVLDASNHQRSLTLPRPFVGPLVLVAIGLLAGTVTGRDAGAGLTTIFNAARTVFPVVVVPVLVVQVVRTGADVRRALAWTGGMAVFKACAGVAVLAAGQSPAGEGPLTYYAAPANILTMAFLLMVLAARLHRVRLPAWVLATLPVVAASLLLSYRRSFWIATVFGLLVVAVVAVGQSARRTLIPLAAIGVVGVFVALSAPGGGQLAAAGASNGSSLTLGSRLASLRPQAVTSNGEDRYRIDERRNVLAQLRGSPIAGVGLGVAYTQRYPLPIGNITREYVHFALLWWWMKLGIIGLFAYPWMMGAGILAGLRTWRRGEDRLIAVAGLAGAAAIAALVVAELTATFVGADLRSSVVVGGLFGLLSATATLSAQTGEPDDALI